MAILNIMNTELFSLGFGVAVGVMMAGFAGSIHAGDIPSQPGYVRGEFIFTSAPFPSCHASTIAETKSGLVAAWFGGKHEKHPSVGIWVARLENSGWTAP